MIGALLTGAYKDFLFFQKFIHKPIVIINDQIGILTASLVVVYGAEFIIYLFKYFI